MMKRDPKVRKILNRSVQVAIFALCCWFIFDRVVLKTDLASLELHLRQALSTPGNTLLLILSFLLMMVNWLTEAVKWQLLLSRIEAVPLTRAIQAVFTGISVSTFTPNRTGEYLGRVFVLQHASRIEGALITVVGSMSQLLVTLSTGTLAFIFFLPRFLPEGNFSQGYLYYIVFVLILLLNLLLYGLYLNIPLIPAVAERYRHRIIRRLRRFLKVLSLFSSKELLVTWFLSFTRWMIFTLQFFLILRGLGLPVSYPDTMILVALIYLIMTLVPTIALTELGMRGSVAVWFFAFITETGQAGSAAIVLAASVILWLINLALPAITGAFFIFRLRFLRDP